MRFFAIASLILALVITAGATERASLSTNPAAYHPTGEVNHGPQNGEGFVITEQRAADVYYSLGDFMAVIEGDYYFDDFSWLSWGTIGGELTYQFGPVNGYSYTASAGNGLYSIPGAVSTNSAEDPLTLMFDGLPVTAVAGDFFATDFDGIPMPTTVTVALDDGTIVMLTFPTVFVGFTTVEPIVWMTLTTTAGDGLWPTYDNFYVGQMASVPVEDSSWGHIKGFYR
jgi:hypothetical protein